MTSQKVSRFIFTLLVTCLCAILWTQYETYAVEYSSKVNILDVRQQEYTVSLNWEVNLGTGGGNNQGKGFEFKTELCYPSVVSQYKMLKEICDRPNDIEPSFLLVLLGNPEMSGTMPTITLAEGASNGKIKYGIDKCEITFNYLAPKNKNKAQLVFTNTKDGECAHNGTNDRMMTIGMKVHIVDDPELQSIYRKLIKK